MRGLAPVLIGALVAVSFAAPSRGNAETYQLDGFVDNEAVGFQGGFINGEIAAVCFQPPASSFPIRLTAIQLLYGGDRLGTTIFNNFKVWNGGGDGAQPSDLVLDLSEVELTSANDALNSVDLNSAPSGAPTVTGPSFCVGIEFTRDGLPSIARDNDGSIDARNNWVYALDPSSRAPLGWFQSNFLGLTGDWIIRVEGTPSGGGGGTGPDRDAERPSEDVGGPTPDAGVGGDAGVDDIFISTVEPTSICEGEDAEVSIEGGGLGDPDFVFRVGPATLDDVQRSGTTRVTGTLSGDDGLAPDTYDVIVLRRGTEVVAFRQALQIRACELPPPNVRDITPRSTSIGDSTTIVVTGTNFVEDSEILIGGRAVPSTTFLGAASLQGFLPGDHVSASGLYDVSVRTPDGQLSTLPQAFEFESGGGGGGGCAVAPTPSGPAAWFVALIGFALVRRRRR